MATAKTVVEEVIAEEAVVYCDVYPDQVAILHTDGGGVHNVIHLSEAAIPEHYRKFLK